VRLTFLNFNYWRNLKFLCVPPFEKDCFVAPATMVRLVPITGVAGAGCVYSERDHCCYRTVDLINQDMARQGRYPWSSATLVWNPWYIKMCDVKCASSDVQNVYPLLRHINYILYYSNVPIGGNFAHPTKRNGMCAAWNSSVFINLLSK
jgi:hypothetical protein